MIHSYMGKPGAGMTLRSTPPVENSNPEGGPKGADGQGVCTLSETDISLLRSYNERVEAHELLNASCLSRKSGPFAAAMFIARCALRSASEKNVEDFRSWGMLLHVGAVK